MTVKVNHTSTYILQVCMQKNMRKNCTYIMCLYSGGSNFEVCTVHICTTMIGPGRMGGGGQAKDKRRDGEQVRGEKFKRWEKERGRKKEDGKGNIGRGEGRRESESERRRDR
jgi:hypothetical protein